MQFSNNMSRRKPGARSYKHYSDRQMELCLSDIENHILTQREASEKYKIPRSSIILKIKAIRTNNIKRPGRQCVFSEDEELAFVYHAMEMCRFGFPITIFDLRCIVKSYLDKKGIEMQQFPNNLPGRMWAQLFLKRHKKELSQRLCSNIKRVRAAVNEETIRSYFNHLKMEIEGVPPDMIYNYDETNLVDDPGKKKVLTKRGTKYPEAIKNSTKAAFSLMMCGNAAGKILPPYVNYKSENLWNQWTEGGPPNSRYNRSKSGWFDAKSFEDWFFTTLLPVLRKEEGKKVIIGDNLSSHLSCKVIEACEQYNIAFVALPPNSTHLTQPLDVAYFRPLKYHWRKILDDWKSTREGQILPTIPKQRFPALLKELWEKILVKSADNLQAGFSKAGIYPTNELPVLERLPTFKHPQPDRVSPSLISDSFVQFLEDKRKQVIGQAKGGRKKKLNVPAGKSISSEELKKALSEQSTSESKKGKNKRKKEVDDVSETEAVHKPSTSKSKLKNKRRKEENSDSETEVESDQVELRDDSDSEGPLLNEESDEDMEDYGAVEPRAQNEYKSDDYVVVEYEGELWPGQIQRTESDGAYVKCMARCGLAWKWPEKEDLIFYPKGNIKFKIEPPKKLSTKRALFQVVELESKWGASKK